VSLLIITIPIITNIPLKTTLEGLIDLWKSNDEKNIDAKPKSMKDRLRLPPLLNHEPTIFKWNQLPFHNIGVKRTF
jgi:hypothetical protein